MPGCYSLPRKLTYSATSCYDACSSVDKEGYYSDNTDFVIGGLIYQNSGCTVLGNQGYYSDIQEGGDTCYEVNSSGVIIASAICFSYITKFKDCNSDNTFRFVGTSIPSTVDNTYYISGSPFFDGCATIITDDEVGEVFDSSGVIFTLLTDCTDISCPSCGYIEFCFGTSYSTLSGYSGNFLSAGTYSGKAYFTGDGISGGTIYHTGDRWCLSNTLGGICLLEGKTPCTTDCPNFASNSFDFGPCPTPTPTPVGNFAIDFNAYFDVSYVPPVTPTVSTDCAVVDFNFTNSPIPPTPSASPVYSLGLNFSIFYSSPTPTPSVTATPTMTPTNILEILGRATFTIIDPPYDCSTVKVLLVCGTVNTYYYVAGPILYNSVQLVPGTIFNANITSPNGTNWSCVQYVGDDSTLSSNSTINLVYSLFSKCEDCLPLPSTTPTQTQTQTQTPEPTITLTQTPTNTETPTQTPTNTETPTQTPTTTPTPTQPLDDFTGIIDTTKTYSYYTFTNIQTGLLTATTMSFIYNGTPTAVTLTSPKTATSIRNNIATTFPTATVILTQPSSTSAIYDITPNNTDVFGNCTIDSGTITPVSSSTYSTFTLPFISTGTYNCIVNWGDGNLNPISTWNDPNTTHVYSSPGVYTITISSLPGNLTGWRFNNAGDSRKLIEVTKWGPMVLGTTQGSYFYGSRNLVLTATSDTLKTSATTNFQSAFRDCYSLTTVNNMNSWNMSQANNMSSMFANATGFNQNISAWTTSAVTNTTEMFDGASSFNQIVGSWDMSKNQNMSFMFRNAIVFDNLSNTNISGWTTSGVTQMQHMFINAEAFNRDIGNWDTSKVNAMNYMFSEASSFNNGGSPSINNWVTSAVTDMGHMFFNASSFNQPIGSWDVRNVTSASFLNGMIRMLSSTSFDQDISYWDVSNVVRMDFMFYNSPFTNNGNPDISGWTTSAVTSMGGMFGFTPFNLDISNWDLSNVGSTTLMFQGNTAFNQNISNWNLSAVTNMSGMFQNATSFNNLGSPLISGWTTSNVANMTRMFNGATSFNQPVGGWDVSKVSNMSEMFRVASSFNNSGFTDINNWVVTGVTNMIAMFRNATVFNQPIDLWNTTSLTNSSYLFTSAPNFNQNLSNWDVSKVTDMRFMFSDASLYNNLGDDGINNWVVTAATNMEYMFFNSSNFNQPISGWQPTNATTLVNFMSGTTNYPTARYNEVLISWSTLGLEQNVIANFGTSQSSGATALNAKDTLTGVTYNWTITDGGHIP
jgi:surface protein